MDRTYLYVPPEEKAEVQALGAHWDTNAMCWYIGADEDAAKFASWLPGGEDDEKFSITSTEAYVASAMAACQKCHERIEVICIYCEHGTVSDEPLNQFTVSGIWQMADSLARRLAPWPSFKKVPGADDHGDYFANHCPHCDAVQDDMYLHDEPDDPLYNVQRAPPGSIKLTPLVGEIQLSGSESFEI